MSPCRCSRHTCRPLDHELVYLVGQTEFKRSSEMKLRRDLRNGRSWGLGMAALALLVAPGCAALTNPVADGIPVSRLPDEVFGESKEGFKQVPLNLLGQE